MNYAQVAMIEISIGKKGDSCPSLKEVFALDFGRLGSDQAKCLVFNKKGPKNRLILTLEAPF